MLPLFLARWVSEDALVTLAADLMGAEQLALVLGSELNERARQAAQAVAELTGARVFVAPLTARAVFDERHPLFAGFLQPSADQLRATLAPYDFIALLGAPLFTLHVYAGGAVLASGAKVTHLCDNSSEGAWSGAGRFVLGDPSESLSRLEARLRSGRDNWFAQSPTERFTGPDSAPAAEHGEEPVLHRMSPSQPGINLVERATAGPEAASGPLKALGPLEAPQLLAPEDVLALLARILPADAVILEEAPTHRNAIHAHLPIKGSQRYHVAASGGLGWAMPAAVGMALAEPERVFLVLIGDGSSLYSIQALWSAEQRSARVIFLVLNNGGYAAVKAFSRRLEIADAPGLDIPGIDFVQLASGFGLRAQRVEQAAELETELSRALTHSGPSLLDVVVGPAAGELY